MLAYTNSGQAFRLFLAAEAAKTLVAAREMLLLLLLVKAVRCSSRLLLLVRATAPGFRT
jgi:hypothetical protein